MCIINIIVSFIYQKTILTIQALNSIIENVKINYSLLWKQ